MKKVLVLGSLLSVLFIGGCVDPSAPTPFDRSISEVSDRYDSDAVADGKFLDAVESVGLDNQVFSDEERIRYGKLICTLLDESEVDVKEIIEKYEGEEQAVSDAAIQVYCPHHLK